MASSLSRQSTLAIGDTAATAIAWRLKGELRVTVIVKATFAFANDAAMARVKPLPIFTDDVHHAKNPLRSVLHASDLVPYRKRADVLFTGHAHAPGGAAVESIGVRLGVASGGRVVLDKRLHLRKKGGFKRIPILYEHTLGGPGHPENPQGEDEGSDDHNIFDPADASRPAGLGPLGKTAPARQRQLGRIPLPQLGASPVQIPDNFDFDFFQAAPADQQIGFLRGDEWILLENLNPKLPSLRTALPGARALARIHGLSEIGIPEGRPLAMSADTLSVSGDEELCTVVWRGTFPIGREDALGAVRVAAGVELPGQPIVWPDAAELARASEPVAEQPASAPASATETMVLSDANETVPITDIVGKNPTLPFRAPAMGAAAIIAASVASRAQRPAPSRGSAGETLPIPSRRAHALGGDALPFAPAQGAEKPAAPESSPSSPPSPEPAAEAPKKAEAVWAPAPPAAVEEPSPPPKKKLPPKVDVNNKLYGTKKKG